MNPTMSFNHSQKDLIPPLQFSSIYLDMTVSDLVKEEVIESVLRGKDTIVLLPTGGGKTVIYSLAAVVLSGITFVIQPLKSLMEEQVNTLHKKNIVAFFINTYLSEEQIRSVTNSLMDKSLKYAVVFTSPEKIN